MTVLSDYSRFAKKHSNQLLNVDAQLHNNNSFSHRCLFSSSHRYNNVQTYKGILPLSWLILLRCKNSFREFRARDGVPQDHNLPAAEPTGIIFKGHTLELSTRGRNFPPNNELFRPGLNISRETAAEQVYDPKVEMGFPVKTKGITLATLHRSYASYKKHDCTR